MTSRTVEGVSKRLLITHSTSAKRANKEDENLGKRFLSGTRRSLGTMLCFPRIGR